MEYDEELILTELSTPRLRIAPKRQQLDNPTATQSNKKSKLAIKFEDVYKEDWQLRCGDLSTRGLSLLKAESWTDVTFIVGVKEDYIKAHKLVLASASPVLAAMLYGPLAEKTTVIRVPDVTPEIFNIMLEFIYTDNIQSINIEKLPEIDYISNKYIIPRLMKGFANGLKENLNINNVIRCYEFAAAIKYQPLIEKCDEIFSSQTDQLLASLTLDSLKYTRMETLQHIFSLEILRVQSELDLLSFIERFAEANGIELKNDANIQSTCDNHKPTVRPLLQQIRFLSLESSVLAKHYQRLWNFFTNDEILVLMLHANSASSVPMLPGFSTNRNPRILNTPALIEISGQISNGHVFYVSGTVLSNAQRFHISLQSSTQLQPFEGSDTVVPLYLSFRFDEDCMVKNTYQRSIHRVGRPIRMFRNIHDPVNLIKHFVVDGDVSVKKIEIMARGSVPLWFPE